MKPIRGINGLAKQPSLTGLAGLGCLLLLGCSCAAAEVPAAELQKAEQVRRLTTPEAERRIPVRLRGVVTFFDEGLFSHFVQDDTAGIYLTTSTNLPPLVAGQWVDVEGVTGAGEFAPVVIPSGVKVLGEAPLPAAQPASTEQLVGGQKDSQFVEVKGVVRSVNFEKETQNFLVDIMIDGERFTAYAKELPGSGPETLVESVVKVHGVASTLFNRQRQLFGFRLLVPRPVDLVIEKPAASNPFDLPTQSISSLLQFTPQGTFGHRVKVCGTVAYQESGIALFLQDEKEGLYCQTRQRTPLQAGDRVEVVGFPAKGEYTPVLQDAVYRKVGTGAVPEPASVDLDEVLTGTHDCRLVRINAKLLERTQRGREQFLVLDTGTFIFHAYLGQDAGSAAFAELPNGSEVSVAGICLIERGSGWRAGEGWRAKSFRLLLRSPGDITLLQSPPWWTKGNTIERAALAGVIALVILVLIDVLRRRGPRRGAGSTRSSQPSG
jgi:hypothetical protein